MLNRPLTLRPVARMRPSSGYLVTFDPPSLSSSPTTRLSGISPKWASTTFASSIGWNAEIQETHGQRKRRLPFPPILVSNRRRPYWFKSSNPPHNIGDLRPPFPVVSRLANPPCRGSNWLGSYQFHLFPSRSSDQPPSPTTTTANFDPVVRPWNLQGPCWPPTRLSSLLRPKTMPLGRSTNPCIMPWTLALLLAWFSGHLSSSQRSS